MSAGKAALVWHFYITLHIEYHLFFPLPGMVRVILCVNEGKNWHPDPLKSWCPQSNRLFPYLHSYSTEMLDSFPFASSLQKYTELRKKKKFQIVFRHVNKAAAIKHSVSPQRLSVCLLWACSFFTFIYCFLSFPPSLPLSLEIQPVVVLPDQAAPSFQWLFEAKLVHMGSCIIWSSHNKMQRFWANFCLLLSLGKWNPR